MKKSFLLLIFFTVCLFSDEYKLRKEKITSDSLKLHEMLNSLGSEIVKKQMRVFLNKIPDSKRILEPYEIDIYERQKHNYKHSASMISTVDELLDSINTYISSAGIFRINNLEFDDNGKDILLADNSFKVLDQYPEFRKKNIVMELIEDILLKGNSKSSLEWIWGKSRENDAYFSTKLTYYDNRFSLYPCYRFYIGKDPLRDKNSWYFSLNDYPSQNAEKIIQKDDLGDLNDQNIVITEDIKETADTVPDQIPEQPVFDCGGNDYDLPRKISLSITKYTKEKGSSDLSSEYADIELRSFMDKVLSVPDRYKFIRLKGTDYIIRGNEIKKSSSDTVIEISGDPEICRDRLSAYIYEAVRTPDRKRSVELIKSVNTDRLSYNATVLTVYDGQTTYFEDYKISASSETRKNKSGWFLKLNP